jgi:hypothetical protein
MVKQMNTLKYVVLSLCLVAANAFAEDTQYYDYPAVGTCVSKYPKFALSLAVGNNGELVNKSGEEMDVVCGFPVHAPTSSNYGKYSAYVYGRVAINTDLVKCKLRTVRSDDGSSTASKDGYGGANSSSDLNYRVRLDSLTAKRDVVGFSMPIIACTLSPDSRIRTIRLFAVD